ncbi:MAG: MMPL family transporter [Fuerstiella sp.]|nr:MMPL family transporter [Fuerstiella sp.]
MFQFLGRLSSRHAGFVVATWIVLLVSSLVLAPEWAEVAENGEFAFLPPEAPSHIAEEQFASAFDDTLASNVVLVVRRETSVAGLKDSDKQFIRETLIPKLREVAELPPGQDTHDDDTEHKVSRLHWFGTRGTGSLFISEDHQATLIILQLATEFLDQDNAILISDVETMLDDIRRTPHRTSGEIPAGLDISFSGSATFGRDIMHESNLSARSTEKWTVILVVVLLIIIYRAPLLAFIPLVTVVTATVTSLSLLATGAGQEWVTLFNGIETYVTVILYGAGVDYCLFLIARYREELQTGATIEEAVARTLERVGAALTASAGTVMCGIGMMVFAEFGKFRQAGIAITFGLAICLAASLTLTPAILRLFGRWAFWPNVARQSLTGPTGWIARSDMPTRIAQANLLQRGWIRIGQLLTLRPLTFLAGSILLLVPFAAAGVAWFGHLSYGLLTELPDSSPCVQGAQALTAHFPAGESGLLNVLVTAETVDFYAAGSIKGNRIVRELTENLVKDKEKLGLHTVRSMTHPAGQRPLESAAARITAKTLGRRLFASKSDPSVTRLELILHSDPFDRGSIEEFRTLRDRFAQYLPEEIQNAKLSFLGATPNLSDLKEVTDRDQIRIDSLVMLGVFLILVVLLKRPGVCGYLMFTVFLSYLATLGFTFMVFWALEPDGFAGLDWKVPLFLFTILIAVGEDYNIFLMTRIQEETEQHGDIEGITVALQKTGSIISSCGIVMAGTFASLLAGSLVGMDQLGFALATGVLLDTFLVRPVMVPSFLILLAQGRLGIFSRLAGYRSEAVPTSGK